MVVEVRNLSYFRKSIVFIGLLTAYYRGEARSQLSQSPFFAAWDPAVLDIYLECGLYSPPEVRNSLLCLKDTEGDSK